MQWIRMSDQVKATATYSLIILLGFVLSYVVYSSVKQVSDTTKALVEKQIPTLSAIQKVITTLSERERTLYEYYSTNDKFIYQRNFVRNKQHVNEQIDELARYFPDSDNIAPVYASIAAINKAAKALDSNLQSEATDWDLARLQLTDISYQRRNIVPLLKILENDTKEEVSSAHRSTLRMLSSTSTTVIIYSFSIIIISLIIGQYMRIYFRVSRRNKRLALLSERNPHPIISVNQYRKVIYYNPATEKLLDLSQDNPLQIADLIPDDFLALCVTAKKDKSVIRVEHSLVNITLSCEIHWLKDLNVFDLHISDITEEKKAKEKLQFQAFHYQDTSLHNSYKLAEALVNKIKNKQVFSLGEIEMRNYNRFVAGHGVEASLELIRGIASRLYFTVSLSEHDLELFQINEKTFAFIINDIQGEFEIKTFHHFVESQMAEILPTPFGEFSIELDYGFCSFPEHGNNSDTLLQNARIALDEAINNEHARFNYYNHQLSQQLNYSLTLTGWLKNAIKNNEMRLVYQPQLALLSQRIIGMEALLRWQHQGEYISPAEFIPIAEQTGLIIDIGQWILLEACTVTKNLIDQGHEDIVIAVNISPRQFRHPNFLTMIKQILKDTGLSPKNLELEITEGVMLYNENETIQVLHHLKALGLMLSIDDFGTGYSSLSYLKQFPIDKLKIDQSFIRNLHNNEEDKAIVQAIIDLGKNLGLKTIAEGVEIQTHFEFLNS
ncbi:MAG: EAL domain-containing protein (putative c-di-GMP-specific phosphodiesterase class I), partial [Alteromonadaceae bacterium]